MNGTALRNASQKTIVLEPREMMSWVIKTSNKNDSYNPSSPFVLPDDNAASLQLLEVQEDCGNFVSYKNVHGAIFQANIKENAASFLRVLPNLLHSAFIKCLFHMALS